MGGGGGDQIEPHPEKTTLKKPDLIRVKRFEHLSKCEHFMDFLNLMKLMSID